MSASSRAFSFQKFEKDSCPQLRGNLEHCQLIRKQGKCYPVNFAENFESNFLFFVEIVEELLLIQHITKILAPPWAGTFLQAHCPSNVRPFGLVGGIQKHRYRFVWYS